MNQDTVFLGGDVDATIRALKDLAENLDRLRQGRGPDLSNAPLLLDWGVAARPCTTLAGRVEGHPVLGDATVRTSEVYAMDRRLGWARTLSRFYRLGPPLAARKEAGR